jgi:uncharacterized protein YabN with tetrapyrrole methylase and pyrophosphatase domain
VGTKASNLKKKPTPSRATKRAKVGPDFKGIGDLLGVMERLRAPDGCPWDREQDHKSLRWHAVEEVYELLDAIEAEDEHEMIEELGDLLLQVVFHCQLGKERSAFDFNQVAGTIAEKLIRRHPHVFGNLKVDDVDQVWTNWEKIKRAEKEGTHRARPSALDGIPKHLPALMRAEKLLKKARRAKLPEPADAALKKKLSKAQIGRELFQLAAYAQKNKWSAESLLRSETLKQEKAWRKAERKAAHVALGISKRGNLKVWTGAVPETPISKAVKRARDYTQ